MNIVLFGFMGTGKTTIAKELSRLSGMKYVSTDEAIEKKERMKISEIFASKGEPYFREIEKFVVRQVSEKDGQIIDTGGGVVMNVDNVDCLKKNGLLISLWADEKDIYERTKQCADRPLLNVPDPVRKIRELLAARKPFYERAGYHINTSEMNIIEAALAILSRAGVGADGPKQN